MPKARVLLVDDSKQTRSALRDILEKNQYEVIAETDNGAEAVKLFSNLSPDIVMLDIIMPTLGGIETLRMLHSLDKSAKVIMVSALDSLDRVKECMKVGARHYILKPFEEAKVIEILRKVLGE